jgi:hypothetical protein
MAFTAIVALAAGAEVTAPLVLAAVAEVGTAMTVVGAVTGSKDLMKVGGIMGLVGGVGGMVAGAAGGAAGAAGTADAASSDGIISSAVDSSPSAAPSMMDAAANPTDMRLAAGTQGSIGSATDLGWDPTAMQATAAATDPTAMPGDPTTPDATGSTVDTTTSGAGASSVSDPWSNADPSLNPGGAPGQTPSQPISSTPVTNVTTPAGTVTTPAVTPPTATPAASNPTDMRLATATQTTPMGSNMAPIDSQSYLQKIMGYLQNPQNKTVLELGSKLAGGALQGMQQEKQFQQRLSLEQQRINQTSYGSQVGQNRPHGIISGARA